MIDLGTLAELVAAGHGSRRLPVAVRYSACGSPGQLQVRPPAPTRAPVGGWMEAPTVRSNRLRASCALPVDLFFSRSVTYRWQAVATVATMPSSVLPVTPRSRSLNHVSAATFAGSKPKVGVSSPSARAAERGEPVVVSLLVLIETESSVEQALFNFLEGPSGFADCLITAHNRRLGCTATATFDTKAARTPGFIIA